MNTSIRRRIHLDEHHSDTQHSVHQPRSLLTTVRSATSVSKYRRSCFLLKRNCLSFTRRKKYSKRHSATWRSLVRARRDFKLLVRPHLSSSVPPRPPSTSPSYLSSPFPVFRSTSQRNLELWASIPPCAFCGQRPVHESRRFSPAVWTPCRPPRRFLGMKSHPSSVSLEPLPL
jgi:hypothetical protein